MMAKNVGRDLKRIMLDGRSALYRWMYEHHSEIAPIVRARPAWQALANTAKEHGVKTVNGADPSRQTVRKMWQQVEQDVLKENGHQASDQTTTATRPAPVMSSAPEIPGQPRKRLELKPVTIRKRDQPSAHVSDQISDAARARFREKFKPLVIPKR
jgi:hypothetical protein